jgi:hypothetical protein
VIVRVIVVVIIVVVFVRVVMTVIVMAMIVRVIVRVIVSVSVSMSMSVSVSVSVPMIVSMMMVVMCMLANGRGVGASLRLEGRIDDGDFRAEALQQCLDRRIAFEPQPALQHLHRHMAVAEMPGQPRQRRKVRRPRLDQRLGLRDHFDQPSIVEHQRVVGAQTRGLGKIEFDAGAFDAEHKALLRLALRERQDQCIDDWGIAPLGSRQKSSGAWHE